MKKGKIKTHHFAHKNLDDCGRGLETALHMKAKEILMKSNVILLPSNFEQNKLFNYNMKMSDFGTELYYESVVLEKRVDDIIPDVILYSNGFPLLIEIKVTHGIDEVKLDKIAMINIPLIEITLDYEYCNQESLNDILQNIMFKSVKEKSIIRSAQDCLEKIHLINKMDFFSDELNFNESILLPTRKYLTFNQYTFMEDGIPPKFAFLIADNTEVLVDEFKITDKNYNKGNVTVDIKIGKKNVLCVFNFKEKDMSCRSDEKYKLYDNVLMIEVKNLDAIRIFELLKSKDFFNKYFIKNNVMEFLKEEIYKSVKKEFNNKNCIKQFGYGNLYGKQIKGYNCPKTKNRAILKTCEGCSSLIKQEEFPRDTIICGEEFEIKQVFVKELYDNVNLKHLQDPSQNLISFEHHFEFNTDND